MNLPFKLAYCCLITVWVSNCGDIRNKMPLFWWSTQKNITWHDPAKKNKLGRKPAFVHPQLSSSHVFLAAHPEVIRRETNTTTQASPFLNPATVQSCLVPCSPPPWILKRMHAYPVGIFPLFLRFSFLPLSPRLSQPPPPPTSPSHIGVLWLKRSRTD